MNVELERANLEPSKLRNLKEADDNRSRGDDEISTSCICCKFKPNCDDAIPYYSSAADIYHGANQWKDEIYCREKLAFCFRKTNSPWEEGNEYEKIAKIYLNNLRNMEACYQSTQNAYNSYFIKAEYASAIKCLTSIATGFLDNDEDELAEKCLKLAYDGFLQVFHVVSAKTEESNDFLYKALDKFIAILVSLGKLKEAVDANEKAIKVIEPSEQDKSRTAEAYRLLLITYILNGDEGIFKDKAEAALTVCVRNSDRKMIDNVSRLYAALKEGNEKRFDDCMIELNVELPIEITRKLSEMIKKKPIEKQSSGGGEGDSHVVLMQDENYL